MTDIDYYVLKSNFSYTYIILAKGQWSLISAITPRAMVTYRTQIGYSLGVL
jgi:hypothetical protein